MSVKSETLVLSQGKGNILSILFLTFVLWLMGTANPTVRSDWQIMYSQMDSVRVRTYIYQTTDRGAPLALDLYLPDSISDDSPPMVLYVHGGGFSGGSRNEEYIERFAHRLVRAGIPVASMSYRLTARGIGFGCERPYFEKLQTFQWAAEDIRVATNFLLSRAEEWSRDSARIVLAGSSAGAEAALFSVFHPTKTAWPKAAKLPKKFEYAGLISMAGAVIDTSLIKPYNSPPTLLFHGEKDDLIPFHFGAHRSCDSTARGFLPLYGGLGSTERLRELGRPYTLVSAPEGGHEWNAVPLLLYYDWIIKFIKEDVYCNYFRQLEWVADGHPSWMTALYTTPELMRSRDPM